jgi:hypothetical protein
MQASAASDFHSSGTPDLERISQVLSRCFFLNVRPFRTSKIEVPHFTWFLPTRDYQFQILNSQFSIQPSDTASVSIRGSAGHLRALNHQASIPLPPLPEASNL